MFTDISNRTLKIVKKYVKKKGLWRVTEEEGFVLLREMIKEISVVYGFSVPRLDLSNHEHYINSLEQIGLPKVSLVSALHEFRHHMQKKGRKRYDDIEVDARAWSISVFKLALPYDFDSAWRRGMIWYLPIHPENRDRGVD